MLCLTVEHPWVYAITRGDMRVYSTDWKPPQRIVGTWCGIYGRSGLTHRQVKFFRDDLNALVRQGWLPMFRRTDDLIVCGIAALAFVERIVHEDDADPLYDRWFTGPYGIVLSDLVVFDRPILTRGETRIWEADEDVSEALAQEFHAIRERWPVPVMTTPPEV